MPRRRILELASCAAFGLPASTVLRAREHLQTAGQDGLFGRARSCVVIFLWGGPGQQDLWDPKPQAPSVLRSEFAPIRTSVPGIDFTDQLPHTAQQAHRLTVIRSMTHRDFEHGTAAYTALTGHPHPQPGTNTPARPDDFPTYGSVISRLTPTPEPVPDFVVLGPVMHQGARPPLAGQNAGFLGSGFDAFRVPGDPNTEGFAVSGVNTPADVGMDRFDRRRELLTRLDQPHWAENEAQAEGVDELYRRAFGLLGSASVSKAFRVNDEPTPRRDRYGRTRFGQSLLLARRLVEARIPLVTVNWSKLNADQWDTHKNNTATLRKLLPPFDQAFAAFLADLDDRGLLDSTLVVCLGEFGRTPKINESAGRDHWPDCYSLVLAGAGIGRGRVYGASNRTAAYPTQDDTAPWDVAATLYHLMGISPARHISNRQGQPLPIARGRVLTRLF